MEGGLLEQNNNWQMVLRKWYRLADSSRADSRGIAMATVGQLPTRGG
jgi:hypothetical protein